MLVIPAIDLLDGKAVRLHKGDYKSVTEYSNNPIELASQLCDAGIRRLHLVDLDAARGKGGNNRPIIASIRQMTGCEIEVGGGIRTQSDCTELLDAGVNWLIIGTAIVKKPTEVASWISSAPGKFIAGIDALDGLVKIAGWIDSGAIRDIDLAVQVKQMGFQSIIYTNISRDGTLHGPDIPRTLAVARHCGLPVILSGGIGSLNDIEAVATCQNQGISGFITGKAMYENRFQLSDVLKRFPQ